MSCPLQISTDLLACNLLVLVDHLPKFVELVVLKDKTTDTLLRQSDGGEEFNSDPLRDVCQALYTHTHTYE